MSNFWMRTITGFSMVFLIMFLMYIHPMAFAGLFLLVTVLGLIEFYSLIKSETLSPQKWTGIILGSILYVIFSCLIIFREPGNDISGYLLLVPLCLGMLVFIVEIFRNRPNPIGNISYTLLGIFYIALPLSFMMILAGPYENRDLFGFPSLLFGYFLLTWLYDTGAYLSGMTFGKHKFFERISPKKTWEGIIGGFVVACGVAAALTALVPAIAWYHWFALMFIVVIFGTLGDLAESLFKRSLGVKDSGNILPGHGGILDRFDTVLISAPFVFLYFVFIL